MTDTRVFHHRLVKLERLVQQLAGTARQLRGEVESMRETTSVAQQPTTLWNAVGGASQPSTTAPPTTGP